MHTILNPPPPPPPLSNSTLQAYYKFSDSGVMKLINKSLDLIIINIELLFTIIIIQIWMAHDFNYFFSIGSPSVPKDNIVEV